MTVATLGGYRQAWFKKGHRRWRHVWSGMPTCCAIAFVEELRSLTQAHF